MVAEVGWHTERMTTARNAKGNCVAADAEEVARRSRSSPYATTVRHSCLTFNAPDVPNALWGLVQLHQLPHRHTAAHRRCVRPFSEYSSSRRQLKSARSWTFR